MNSINKEKEQCTFRPRINVYKNLKKNLSSNEGISLLIYRRLFSKAL